MGLAMASGLGEELFIVTFGDKIVENSCFQSCLRQTEAYSSHGHQFWEKVCLRNVLHSWLLSMFHMLMDREKISRREKRPILGLSGTKISENYFFFPTARPTSLAELAKI